MGGFSHRPLDPFTPLAPFVLYAANFIAAKKPPCLGHQSRASSCGRPFMAVKNPLPSTPLLCGVHLPSLNFYTSLFCTKKTVRVCRPLYALWLNFGINLISISEMITGIRVFINQLKFNHYETIHVQTGPCTGLFRRLRPRGRSQTVSSRNSRQRRTYGRIGSHRLPSFSEATFTQTSSHNREISRLVCALKSIRLRK